MDDRRTRKKRETQQALRLAALRLVAAHGVEHVTVEMIADAADVSPRTFFNYFPTKEEALTGPGSEAVAEVERYWAEAPADEPPLLILRRLLAGRAEALSVPNDEMELQMRVLEANPALVAGFHAGFQQFERVVRLAVARRCGLHPDRDVYPMLLAASGGVAMRVAMDLRRAGNRRRLVDLVTEAFDLYAAGLHDPPPPRPTRRRAAARS